MVLTEGILLLSPPLREIPEPYRSTGGDPTANVFNGEEIWMN
jgi:hypothetical protein